MDANLYCEDCEHMLREQTGMDSEGDKFYDSFCGVNPTVIEGNNYVNRDACQPEYKKCRDVNIDGNCGQYEKSTKSWWSKTWQLIWKG